MAEDNFEGWESGQEVQKAVRATGFTISRTQLARHRAGLIGAPKVRRLSYGRGTASLYPPGTAEQLIRTLEVGRKGESLDDVGWRA